MLAIQLVRLSRVGPGSYFANGFSIIYNSNSMEMSFCSHSHQNLSDRYKTLGPVSI